MYPFSLVHLKAINSCLSDGCALKLFFRIIDIIFQVTLQNQTSQTRQIKKKVFFLRLKIISNFEESEKKFTKSK